MSVLARGWREGCVLPACNSLDGGFETQEAPLLDLSCEFSSYSSRSTSLVHDDASTSLVDRLDDRLNLEIPVSVRRGDKQGWTDVVGLDRPQVDQLDAQ